MRLRNPGVGMFRPDGAMPELSKSLLDNFPPGLGLEDPAALAAAKKMETILAPFDHESKKVVLDEIVAAIESGHQPADRLELLAQLQGLRNKRARVDAAIDAELAARSEHAVNLDAALEQAGLLPLVLEIERRAKDLVLPEPTSAANVETLMMSYGYWLSHSIAAATSVELEYALKGALFRNPLIERVRKKLAGFALHAENQSLLAFGGSWLKTAFARLELGHKLAASLCLTDIPDDVEVRAPWDAWSLVVPDGLIHNLARIWCVGPEPVFVVRRDGALLTYAWGNGPTTTSGAMLRSLVRGACLALSNPEDFRKENQHGPTARAAHRKGRHGPPDLQQARFLLSAPVKIDLREHIANVLSGKSHASPTVQFLVRGHWRNQAHGPKHALRKVIWVPPFWKGPEESRILLRQHRVGDAEKAP